jgi:NTP pyrophosphatase (non-canonical NTP hydrolase)
MNIKELQQTLTKGENPYIDIDNPQAVLLHYVEEVGELIRSLRKNKPIEEVKKELGDNMIMLLFVAASLKLDLEECTQLKIQDNINKGKFKKHSGKVVVLKDAIDVALLHKEIENALGE